MGVGGPRGRHGLVVTARGGGRGRVVAVQVDRDVRGRRRGRLGPGGLPPRRARLRADRALDGLFGQAPDRGGVEVGLVAGTALDGRCDLRRGAGRAWDAGIGGWLVSVKVSANRNFGLRRRKNNQRPEKWETRPKTPGTANPARAARVGSWPSAHLLWRSPWCFTMCTGHGDSVSDRDARRSPNRRTGKNGGKIFFPACGRSDPVTRESGSTLVRFDSPAARPLANSKKIDKMTLVGAEWRTQQ